MKAAGELTAKAGLSDLFGKFVGTMAQNGRSGDILGAAIAFDELTLNSAA